jgi:hypothetical protein
VAIDIFVGFEEIPVTADERVAWFGSNSRASGLSRSWLGIARPTRYVRVASELSASQLVEEKSFVGITV